MSRPDDFSDTDLSAWLDGEFDTQRRVQIDAWLRDHPEMAARVRLWAADRDALRARLDPVLGEPVPPALLHRVMQHRPPARWAQAAVAAGLLVAGALIGAAGYPPAFVMCAVFAVLAASLAIAAPVAVNAKPASGCTTGTAMDEMRERGAMSRRFSGAMTINDEHSTMKRGGTQDELTRNIVVVGDD